MIRKTTYMAIYDILCITYDGTDNLALADQANSWIFKFLQRLLFVGTSLQYFLLNSERLENLTVPVKALRG